VLRYFISQALILKEIDFFISIAFSGLAMAGRRFMPPIQISTSQARQSISQAIR
jgi:hypothetical protein